MLCKALKLAVLPLEDPQAQASSIGLESSRSLGGGLLVAPIASTSLRIQLIKGSLVRVVNGLVNLTAGALQWLHVAPPLPSLRTPTFARTVSSPKVKAVASQTPCGCGCVKDGSF